MDKAPSTSVKDFIIRKMSVRTNIPAKTIEAIVSHQMEDINKALQKEGVYTVEISGFGKLVFNHKKAQKKLEKNLSKEQLFRNKLALPNLTEREIASYTLKLENTLKWMDGIKQKLKGCPQ